MLFLSWASCQQTRHWVVLDDNTLCTESAAMSVRRVGTGCIVGAGVSVVLKHTLICCVNIWSICISSGRNVAQNQERGQEQQIFDPGLFSLSASQREEMEQGEETRRGDKERSEGKVSLLRLHFHFQMSSWMSRSFSYESDWNVSFYSAVMIQGHFSQVTWQNVKWMTSSPVIWDRWKIQ